MIAETARPLFNLETEDGRRHLAEKIKWQGGLVAAWQTIHPDVAAAMDKELGLATKQLKAAEARIKARLVELGIEEG